MRQSRKQRAGCRDVVGLQESAVYKKAYLISALCILLSALPCSAAPWSGILSPSRAIDWSSAGLPPTLPDGETTPNPWTPPTRSQCGSTIAAGASVATINAALASCPQGTYVLLGPGTFTIDSFLQMYGISNVTLRGSGPMSTTLNITNGNTIFMGQNSGSGSGAFSTSYPAGTTSLTLTGVTGDTPVPGMLAWVNQCDTGSGAQPCSTPPVDNGGLFVCGNYVGCQSGSVSSTVFSHQQQMVFVTGVTSNGGGSYTLTISPGLRMSNWTTASGAQMSWQNPGEYVVGLGLEDLTITNPGFINNGSGILYNVWMSNAYASWVKGVRFLGSAPNGPLGLEGHIKNSLVMNNYFAPDLALTNNYHAGVYVGNASEVLVLNNISALGIPTEYRGGNTGVVTAYNYGRDAFTGYAENGWSFDHAAYSSFNLYEGNQSGPLTEDDIWGTHGLNTYFRNYTPCYDEPYAGGAINPRGIHIDRFQRFDNLVGNAVGSPICTAYEGPSVYSEFLIAAGDPLNAASLLRWGNCDTVTQSCRFQNSEVPVSLSGNAASFANTVPADHTLQNSYFLPIGWTPSAGLGWWNVCTRWNSFPTNCATTQTQPYPAVGPEVTGGTHVNGHAYDIPAAVAYMNLPIDTTYQNSYPITASSWAGGKMTLTITGLPDLTHVMGGFQLSGVAPDCNPSSGEQFITDSSPNTISYSLPTNPGVSCTGTFKFPDVRQFDQRVYGSSGNGPQTGACDLNGSGGIPDVADVQMCVNQALQIFPCTNGDIDQDSRCTVVDVQRVVNGALGGTCP